MSTALNAEHLTDLAEMLGVELALIGADTKTSQFLKELRWNNAYHRLAMGF
jgi:L-arabinose isomerase